MANQNAELKEIIQDLQRKLKEERIQRQAAERDCVFLARMVRHMNDTMLSNESVNKQTPNVLSKYVN